MQSLELLLDQADDAAVRMLWQRLADAGLPSQAAHRGASNRPHVTLLARDAVPVAAGDAVAGGLPLAVRLGPPLVLGAGEHRTLALSVVPTAPLLALHAAAHAAAGGASGSPHEAPGAWTPHVTLARRIPLTDVGRALAAAAAEERDARLVALRHWDRETRTVTPIGADD